MDGGAWSSPFRPRGAKRSRDGGVPCSVALVASPRGASDGRQARRRRRARCDSTLAAHEAVAAAASWRPPCGDGARRCAPERARRRAFPESHEAQSAGGMEPARAHPRGAARLLRALLVGQLDGRSSRPRKLRRREQLPRRARPLPSGPRSAGDRDQLGSAERGRLRGAARTRGEASQPTRDPGHPAEARFRDPRATVARAHAAGRGRAGGLAALGEIPSRRGGDPALRGRGGGSRERDREPPVGARGKSFSMRRHKTG